MRIKEKVRKLRRQMTVAEELLWEELRNNKLDVKFRRQHPKVGYILDFYCDSHKLCIEVDGFIHKEQKGNDDHRTETLNSIGIKVIRFTNEQVKNEIHTVLKQS